MHLVMPLALSSVFRRKAEAFLYFITPKVNPERIPGERFPDGGGGPQRWPGFSYTGGVW